MLNLVHQGTVDEVVYARLSEPMRNPYALFVSLPDTRRDDWIAAPSRGSSRKPSAR